MVQKHSQSVPAHATNRARCEQNQTPNPGSSGNKLAHESAHRVSDKRYWLDQAWQRFENILDIVLNPVLLKTFDPLAASVATKADRSAGNTKVQKSEHQGLPDRRLTTSAVDKEH